MKRTLRILSSSLVLLAAAAAHAKDLPGYDASFNTRGPGGAAAAPQTLALPGNQRLKVPSATIASTDPRTGAPAFVWAARPASPLAPAASPADIARDHLAAYAALYGLSPAALATAAVAEVHDTGRGGIIVTFRQSIGGVPLHQHDAKVLLRRDGALVAISGALSPLALDVPKAAGQFNLAYSGAIARALSDMYSMTVPGSALSPSAAGVKGQWSRFDLAGGQQGAAGLTFHRPARARKIYFPLADRLVPAYQIEVFSAEQGGEQDSYGYVVAADDGRVLKRKSLSAHAAFKYRVWADGADGRPMDGPIADFTPHPTGLPDGSYPAFVAPSLVTMDGFNKTQDPWLAQGATQSTGNNVDAYTDHDDSNNANGGDVRATITDSGEFDHVYDTSKEPLASETQQKAAVTQLFYTINWLHDYWYDSGFDEAAGNAQLDNYGRGGEGDDPIRAEAQDDYNGGASDNANMDTPADGESPRMQMFVWSGQSVRSLTIGGDPQSLATGPADFGPQEFDLTAMVALADDGNGTKTDACQPIVNNLSGKIALIDRGDCTFHEKAANAQAAGAVGMILANNLPTGAPNMPGSDLPDVDIPSLSITQAAGTALKAAIAGASVSVTMQRETGVTVDGTIDNLIVAHEWGHYLHHRLVNCGLNQCGAESEGWGDFLALALQVREGDNLDGAFSDSVYASIASDNAAYFGTRRTPYSVDLSKNPFTFKHIQASEPLPDDAPISPDAYPENAEVHNAGEIWASMMFEGYVAILKQSKLATPKYSFDEARRRMADYVVAGMKLAPVEPTFTEQRDGVIAAAFAVDPDDAVLIAEAFAKRGAGSCAVSPPKDSFDNEGVVESFKVGPAIAVKDITIDDTKDSCDKDGVLDAGETGMLTLTIENGSFVAAPDTKVKVTSTTPGVTFPNGADSTLATLDGFGSATLIFDIQIDPKQKQPAVIDVTITAENAAACVPTVIKKQVPHVHYDNAAAVAAKDEFESDIDVWTREGQENDEIWGKAVLETGNKVWHGADYPALSDTQLISPAVKVSDTENLVLSFRHRHAFEASNEDPSDPGSPYVYWDGAVIEISSNGGVSWNDVSNYVDPGYTGEISDYADNPLATRMGYSDENPSYPDFDTVTLDFGNEFAGKEVMVRFRIGTDQAAGDLGWDIDDVAFTGITGTPFPAAVADAQSCSPATDQAPIADAGPDQTVKPGAAVTLDASKSTDPDGDDLTFTWTQVAGSLPGVTLKADGAKATFTAPDVEKETELTFAVKVSANDLSNEDTVVVLVKPSGDELAVTGGACGCTVPGDDKVPAAPLGALGSLLAGLVAYRRRRSGAKK